MAHMSKDGALQGQKSAVEPVSKAPSKILIIPAQELVQVIAKVILLFVLCEFLFLTSVSSVLILLSSLLLLLLLLKLG